MKNVQSYPKPTGVEATQWLMAPEWATHIVRLHNGLDLFWAIRRGDDFFFPEPLAQANTPLLMHPSGEAASIYLGWVVHAARPASSAKTSIHFLLDEPKQRPPFVPEPNGHWQHPAFRWSLIPPGAALTTFFADAGFELTYCTRDIDDDPFDMGCIGWEPSSLGFGWFLVKITTDASNKPLAVFAKQAART